MVVSARHFEEVTNGYEKRTDGLYIHRGKMDVGTLRVTNGLPPLTGAGVEVTYDRAASTGYIYSFNRDTGVYGDLLLMGKNINLSPQGGKVTLPAGTAQSLIGTFMSTAPFSTSSAAAWVATPITTGSIGCTGALVRIEVSTSITHSAAGGAYHTGLMVDGTPLWNCSQTHIPQPNYFVPVAWTIYWTPSATNHIFTLMVYNNIAGTVTLNSNIVSMIHVTEQRA